MASALTPAARRPLHAGVNARRTPLARLRIDEESMARRRRNVQDYGSAWIRPPGVPKSLHQMREERREMEEHQEAMRRDALVQELADAEAAVVAEVMDDEAEGEEGEEGRDLDDDVPDAEGDATGSSGDEEDDEDEDDDDDDHEHENESRVPIGVLAARLPEEAYREALVRGEMTRGAMFDDETGSMVDEAGGEQMLQEEDLVRETFDQGDLDMDGDVNLDDDIPEAEEGGYEHTDTEAELTSSEEEGSVDGRLLTRRQQNSSMVRSDGTQNSMDISRRSLGSSQIGSSPAPLSGVRNRRSDHHHNH